MPSSTRCELTSPTDEIPWYQAPTIRWALVGAGAAIWGILNALGWHPPLSRETWGEILADAAVLAFAVRTIVDRVKRGKNPADPAPALVAKKPDSGA